MTYRKIRLEDKIEAVKRVFWGESVSSVATDMGVGRNSLAIWARSADAAVRSILGRKQAGKRRAASGGARLKRLRARIAQQQKIIKTMCKYLRMSIEGPIPSQCAKCGCSRFYKNGFFMMDVAHLLGKSLHGRGRKIPVQKFVCVNCTKSTRLDVPAALFHWAAGNVRPRMESGRRGRNRAGSRKNSTHPADIMMRIVHE